jgi:hypothetical protein
MRVMGASRQRLIPLEDRGAWDEALEELPHAFAHTWTSCHAMHLTTGWPTFLYAWQDGSARAICAIAERGEAGEVDVVTPYGFGGIVGAQVGPRMLEQWHEFARHRGYVCGYLGLNPVLAPATLRESADYREHNDVYVLELHRGTDALYASLSTNRRRQLHDFTSSSVRLVEDRERLSAWFLRHVDEFLRDKGASSTYAFSQETWTALLSSEDILVLGTERPGGDVAAVCVFGYTPHCAEYLFGISEPDGRSHTAALLWAGAGRLGEKGIPKLNLGGGVKRGDGIAQFKERFGGKRLPLGALKEVYRPEVYATLCQRAGKDPTDRTGFFPAYRAP